MSKRSLNSGRDRDRRVIDGAACPRCRAPQGRPCNRADGKPWPCSERRAEWVRIKPR